MDKVDLKNKLPQEGTSASDGAGESLTRALDMPSTITRVLGCPTYSGGGKGSPNMQINTQPHTRANITTSATAGLCHQGRSAVAEHDTDTNSEELSSSPKLGETENNGINPFTRGGIVQRSPPTKGVDQIAVQAVSQEVTKDSNRGPLATESLNTIRLTKVRERRGSLGSAESLLATAYKMKIGPTGKRMRNEDDGDETQAEIMNAIARLTKITAGLVKIVGDNANTKLEIKTGVRDLKGNIEHLNKMTKYWEDFARKTTKTRAISKHTKEIGIQTEEYDVDYHNSLKRGHLNRNEVGTQTEAKVNKHQSTPNDDIEKGLSESNLKDKIQKCNDFERLAEIINLEWPVKSFNMVKVETGNPLTMDKDFDIVIVANPNRKGQDKPKGIRKMLKKVYPEALELLDDSEKNSVEYTVQTSKSSKMGVAERERWIYVVPCTEITEGPKQVEILYNQIQVLCGILKESGRKKKLAISAEKGINKDHLSKILEILLSKLGLEIKLLIEESYTRKDDDKKMEKRTETLLVKGDGSYADILKKIKTSVTVADMKHIGVSVKSVRKTSNGKVMMKVTGDAEALKDRLLNVVKCTEVGLGRDVIFHITGIEEDVTPEELKAALQTELREPVQLKSIRPTQYGSKSATISMSPLSARNLANVTSVTIGWTRCRLRKRVYIEKCYRCWEIGHKASQCKGPNRADLCSRCSGAEHKALNCTAESYCPLCKVKGHKAATTGCPKFRSAIKAADKSAKEYRKGQLQQYPLL